MREWAERVGVVGSVDEVCDGIVDERATEELVEFHVCQHHGGGDALGRGIGGAPG